MSKQAAVYINPDKLQPWDRNPRFNDAAVEEVMKSIKRFGFGAPIVAQEGSNRVIAGHTRLKAATRLGLSSVPVRFLNLSDSEAAALAIADNKLSELAEWDETQLGDLLKELKGTDMEFEGLGFDPDELDFLIGEYQADDACDGYKDKDGTRKEKDDDEDEIQDEGLVQIKVTTYLVSQDKARQLIRTALATDGLLVEMK